jgi:hypothetical protein
VRKRAGRGTANAATSASDYGMMTRKGCHSIPFRLQSAVNILSLKFFQFKPGRVDCRRDILSLKYFAIENTRYFR